MIFARFLVPYFRSIRKLQLIRTTDYFWCNHIVSDTDQKISRWWQLEFSQDVIMLRVIEEFLVYIMNSSLRYLLSNHQKRLLEVSSIDTQRTVLSTVLKQLTISLLISVVISMFTRNVTFFIRVLRVLFA